MREFCSPDRDVEALVMQDTTPAVGSTKLDETELINELKRLRRQIPDNPSLNPILNVAFDLSRRLESNSVSFDEVKGLAGRLMDRACVRRARGLRAKIGYVDQASTLKDFTSYVEKTAKEAGNSLEAFAERWSRARTGIVLTAHPTFGLSDALYRRMVEIAISDPAADVTIGLPHRPEDKLTLQHEHKC